MSTDNELLSRMDERLKSIEGFMKRSEEQSSATMNAINNLGARVTKVEGHIDSCKADHKLASEIHEVVRANRSRIDKGETRDDLLDSRALKLEGTVEALMKANQELLLKVIDLKNSVDSLKRSYSGWNTFIVAVGTAVVSAVAGGYFTHLFGLGARP